MASITGTTMNSQYWYEYEYEELLKEYKFYGSEMEWTMKDGNTIKIKNMKDSHVKNSINMMKRKKSNNVVNAWIDIFEKELLNRRMMKIDKLKNNILK
jgi:hypothetical protein